MLNFANLMLKRQLVSYINALQLEGNIKILRSVVDSGILKVVLFLFAIIFLFDFYLTMNHEQYVPTIVDYLKEWQSPEKLKQSIFFILVVFVSFNSLLWGFTGFKINTVLLVSVFLFAGTFLVNKIDLLSGHFALLIISIAYFQSFYLIFPAKENKRSKRRAKHRNRKTTTSKTIEQIG
jgi:hypothetical protein